MNTKQKLNELREYIIKNDYDIDDLEKMINEENDDNEYDDYIELLDECKYVARILNIDINDFFNQLRGII